MVDLAFDQVWRWYLYRISICKNAKPNQGHIALSKIEALLPDRFALISQNVDGLHFEENIF
jgi:NAD-dependent protein deacetylases, SIR2 family